MSVPVAVVAARVAVVLLDDILEWAIRIGVGALLLSSCLNVASRHPHPHPVRGTGNRGTGNRGTHPLRGRGNNERRWQDGLVPSCCYHWPCFRRREKVIKRKLNIELQHCEML